MKRYVIDSIESVTAFFADLQARTAKPISSEEDLEKVQDEQGRPVFSKAEVAYFDEIIIDCFVFCADHHLDIYDMVENVPVRNKVQTREVITECLQG